jgi:hypothetical protein
LKLRKKKILIISPESWGVNFVSKHHYALELSQKGNSVFFLNPPSLSNQLKPVSKNLSTINYSVPIRGINRLPNRLRNFINIRISKKVFLLSKVDKFDIVWSFDPFRLQNLKLFESQLSIYHAVDVHHTKLEKEIIRTANIVFASSELILRRLTKNKNNFKIGHGLSHLFKNMKYKFKVNKNPIKVGYVGNLQYKYLDTEIIIKIVNNHPKIEFHFIGPYLPSNLTKKTYHNSFISILKQKHNCIIHGPVPSEELPYLINKFDAFLMCYTSDTLKAELSNPHKILEFLSTGKVVVTHYIDEYKNKKELLEMTKYNKDIPNKFKNVIENLEVYNHIDLQIKRREFAKKNTYQMKINQIEELLNTFDL